MAKVKKTAIKTDWFSVCRDCLGTGKVRTEGWHEWRVAFLDALDESEAIGEQAICEARKKAGPEPEEQVAGPCKNCRGLGRVASPEKHDMVEGVLHVVADLVIPRLRFDAKSGSFAFDIEDQD